MGHLWRERFDLEDEQAKDEEVSATGGSMVSRFMKDPPGQDEGLCVCDYSLYIYMYT